MTGLVGGLLTSLPAAGKPVDLPFSPSEASAMIYVEDVAEIFVRAVLSDNLNSPTYISGGHLATLEEMAGYVKRFIPDAQITFDSQDGKEDSGNYLADSSRLLGEFELEYPPLEQRILQIINDIRKDEGLPLVS